MLIFHICVHVKREFLTQFREATLENAKQSILEPGIARFDVMQDASDPTRFVFLEAYKTADAPAQHKSTEHYRIWRDTVAQMMAEPRASVQYDGVFPADEDY